MTGGGADDLVLKEVRKTFGRTVALDDLDLVVKRGEFVALLGPSGCGKTTALRAIAGFEQPEHGDILIKGESVLARPPYRRDIGVVFQNYALFPHMTVRENVAYGLQMRRVGGAALRERVARALTLVQLGELAGRYPRQLSGGQQQRVAVARAIVIEPVVLLLDEPLSNLDAKLRQTMRTEMRSLQQSLGVATVFVTHDQEEALSMADRVAVMRAGRIEQQGTPEEIYQRPATRFVAEFVGECNFLDGRLSRVDGDGAWFETKAMAFRIVPPVGATVGLRGTVSLRPESIVVVRGTLERPAPMNTVRGTVRVVAYLGAFFQVRVGIEGGPDLLVHVPAQGSHTGRGAPREGEAIDLAWAPEACQLQAPVATSSGS